jgi:hypothetical protein
VTRSFGVGWLCASVLALAAAAALAHVGGSTGYASITVSQSTVRYSLTLPASTLRSAMAEQLLLAQLGLLFLLGLLLPGGGLLSLFKIVTAFTLAHSVTLALAVLDLVHLPDRLVESVIALSIAFIAAENLFPRATIARRWVVSFAFGLVHGFGFSSALRELGLPSQGLALSLLGFNLGVEAGQAMVVALVLPLLLLLQRTSWEPRMVSASSLAILIVGRVLFVERLLL